MLKNTGHHITKNKKTTIKRAESAVTLADHRLLRGFRIKETDQLLQQVLQVVFWLRLPGENTHPQLVQQNLGLTGVNYCVLKKKTSKRQKG